MSATFFNMRRRLAAMKAKETAKAVEKPVEKPVDEQTGEKPKKGKVKNDG